MFNPQLSLGKKEAFEGASRGVRSRRGDGGREGGLQEACKCSQIQSREPAPPSTNHASSIQYIFKAVHIQAPCNDAGWQSGTCRPARQRCILGVLAHAFMREHKMIPKTVELSCMGPPLAHVQLVATPSGRLRAAVCGDATHPQDVSLRAGHATKRVWNF